MRHLLVSSLLLLIAISTYGQTDNPAPQPCTLKLSQAPAVRGVKLGMTIDELLPLFPGAGDSGVINGVLSRAEGYSNFGAASFFITPSDWGNKEHYTGVGSYFFRVFDRRVVGLDVNYDRFPAGPRWKNADELIQRFSESYHLPAPRKWTPDPDNTRKRLKCDGFEITAAAESDRGIISFQNRSWVETQKDRLAAFEDQKRREFKP